MRINDRWMFIGLYPLLAVLVVHVGNENSPARLLRQPSYYTDLLLALACTYAIGFYLRYFYRRLHAGTVGPVGIRSHFASLLFYGIVLPVIVAVGSELIYLNFLPDIRLEDTSVFYLELPLVALFCLLLNLIYYLLYTQQQHRSALKRAAEAEQQAETTYRRNFLIHGALDSRVVEAEEVAYFIILEKTTFLVSAAGGRFPYEHSIEQVAQATDPEEFFPANRQLVLGRAGVVGYRRTETRRLELELSPPAADPQFIPKTKAAEFVRWLER
ncbi:MAG: hypothetical protein WBA17_01355 [Saprospiraceae bacterium]